MTNQAGTRGIPRLAATLFTAFAVSGCATSGTTANAGDPFEGFNRAVFSFNDKVDEIALKPTATAYRDVVPRFIRTGVGNFFGNIGDVWSTANLLMQGKVEYGANSFMRVAVNSTFGIFGLLDIAGEAGISRRTEDFGQTLGYWGMNSGPYLVIPLFGSSTLRDTAALPVDAAGNLWSYASPEAMRVSGAVVRVVDQRASILGASNLLEEVALDKYQFVRDTYLQRRESQINDGVRGEGGMNPNSQGRGLLLR